MSKLAHSNQETMDEIDTARAFIDGNEDLVTGDLKDYTIYPALARIGFTNITPKLQRAFRLGFAHGLTSKG